MVTSMLFSGELVLTLLTHAAWRAGLLALVVLGLTKLLGRHLQPRWRFGLWLIVFARLAVPVLPEASWSVFRVVSSVGTPQAKSRLDARAEISTQIIDDHMKEYSDDARMNGINDLPSPKGGAARLIDLALLIWATGVIVLLIRHTANVVQLRREQRRWLKMTDSEVVSALEKCCRELRYKRSVSLFKSLDNIGPATCGVAHPKIVIPQKLVDCLSATELRLVLLHELVHVRRYDALVDQLIAVVTIFHWFHPVAWISRYFLRSERELACDAAVLEQFPSDGSNEYGHVLLKTIESLARPKVPLPGLVGMFNCNPLSIIHRRIRLIATYRRSTWPALLFGAALLLGLVFVGLTDARSEHPEANPSEKSETTTERNRSEATNARVEEQPKAVNGVANVDPHIKHHSLDVTGRALDQKGHPIAGATIYLASTDMSPSKVIAKTSTDQNGRYEFSHAQLPYRRPETEDGYDAGKFEVFGKSAGLGFAWSGMQWLLIDPRLVGPDGKPTVVDPSNVHLPNNRINLDLTFLPAKPIRGRFLDDQGRAIQNVRVVITDCNYAVDLMGPDRTYEEALKKTHRKFRSIQTAQGAMPDVLRCFSGADGRFELDSVPIGMVCGLRIEHPDYGAWVVSTGTAELLPKEFEGSEVLHQPIEMTREKARTISVRVRYRDNLQPAVGVVVGAYLRLGIYNAVKTSDEQGKATLKLPPAEYTVLAFPPEGKDVLNAESKLLVKPIDDEQMIDLFFEPK